MRPKTLTPLTRYLPATMLVFAFSCFEDPFDDKKTEFLCDAATVSVKPGSSAMAPTLNCHYGDDVVAFQYLEINLVVASEAAGIHPHLDGAGFTVSVDAGTATGPKNIMYSIVGKDIDGWRNLKAVYVLTVNVVADVALSVGIVASDVGSGAQLVNGVFVPGANVHLVANATGGSGTYTSYAWTAFDVVGPTVLGSVSGSTNREVDTGSLSPRPYVATVTVIDSVGNSGTASINLLGRGSSWLDLDPHIKQYADGEMPTISVTAQPGPIGPTEVSVTLQRAPLLDGLTVQSMIPEGSVFAQQSWTTVDVLTWRLGDLGGGHTGILDQNMVAIGTDPGLYRLVVEATDGSACSIHNFLRVR